MSSSDEATRRNATEDTAADGDDDDAESSSEDEQPLFKFPHRAFKRNVENPDSDDSEGEEEEEEEAGRNARRGRGDDDDSASDDDGLDDAFNSPPDSSRVSGSNAGGAAAGRSGRAAEDELSALLSSDDDDGSYEPATKRQKRKVLSSAELEAASTARVDALLAGVGDSDGGGGGSCAQNSATKKDQAYARRMQKKLADATNIDAGAMSKGHLSGAGPAAAAGLCVAASAETMARRAREQDAKRVKLTVVRNKSHRHVFNTKLGTQVETVEDNCRGELDLLSRDEEDDADIALFYQENKLESSQTLRQAGVPAGNVTLRLDVTGGSSSGGGGGGGGGAGGGGGGALGPPITLKVRVVGGKTFSVVTTKGTKFSAFMEGFHEKVGIPPDRAHESVFKFDGGRLNPDGTPEDEDMEPDELIDAKFPQDLMDGVQAAQSEVTLGGAPVKKKAAPKGGKEKSAVRSRTAAAVAAAAKPLGGGASRPQRSTRSGGRRAASTVKEPDVVVLD